MKRVKLLTLAGAVLAVALVAVGCGSTQPAAPAPAAPAAQPAAQTAAPAPAVKPAATYVGEKTCQGCHNKTKFDSTKHVGSFKPMSAYKFDKTPGAVTVYDGANND